MTPRTLIKNSVFSTPGIHFRALAKSTGLAVGQLQHHARLLVKENAIAEAQLFGSTRYFPPNTPSLDRAIIAFLWNPVSKKLLSHILFEQGQHCSLLAEHVGLTPSTISWYLGRLRHARVIETVKHGKQVCVHLVEPARVKTLFDRSASPVQPGKH